MFFFFSNEHLLKFSIPDRKETASPNEEFKPPKFNVKIQGLLYCSAVQGLKPVSEEREALFSFCVHVHTCTCIWQHPQPVAGGDSVFTKKPKERHSRQQTGRYWVERRIG